VILPRTNLGLRVEHEREAYVLDRADEKSIADAVRQLKANPLLKQRLAVGAVAFHRVKCDTSRLGEKLFEFYEARRSRRVDGTIAMKKSA
jgi:hypothetical protein